VVKFETKFVDWRAFDICCAIVVFGVHCDTFVVLVADQCFKFDVDVDFIMTTLLINHAFWLSAESLPLRIAFLSKENVSVCHAFETTAAHPMFNSELIIVRVIDIPTVYVRGGEKRTSICESVSLFTRSNPCVVITADRALGFEIAAS
jgi:hypothetical protein